MTLRFVKTAVLSSTDGIDFSNEVSVESEETRMARLAAERAAQKPLFEQLAEQKQKKQDEYDANTKLLFAPPKALDEEDASFLNTMEDSRQEQERLRKEEEMRQLDVFRIRKDMQSAQQSVPVVKVIPDVKPKKETAPTIIRVAKRKADVIIEADTSKKAINMVDKKNTPDAPPAAPLDTSASTLFADYGSDEESS